jgi:hypothetical protein
MAALCVLAILRPAAALLVTIALAGFGTILAHLAGAPPFRVTEALVVASLVGCGLRALLPGSPNWIALGLTVSQSIAPRPADAPARAPRWRTWTALVLGVLPVASIPFRARTRRSRRVPARVPTRGPATRRWRRAAVGPAQSSRPVRGLVSRGSRGRHRAGHPIFVPTTA